MKAQLRQKAEQEAVDPELLQLEKLPDSDLRVLLEDYCDEFDRKTAIKTILEARKHK